MAEKRINYEINLGVNKASLDNVQKALDQTVKILNNSIKDAQTRGLKESADQWKVAKENAQQLSKILDKTFNKGLSQYDLTSLNEMVKETFGSFENLKNSLADTSSVGAHAWNLFGREVLNTNLQLSEGSKILDDMADTMAKTVKWGIASRIMNNMVSSIEKA